MAFGLKELFGSVVKPISDLASEFITDKDKLAEFNLKAFEIGTQSGDKLVEAQRDIIVAETQSESWFTANWRPVTMLAFVGLVIAHWLGFTAPGISEEQVMSLLDIVKIGLGGYVVGRSAEKVAENWNKK
jgi:hypothetical protein